MPTALIPPEIGSTFARLTILETGLRMPPTPSQLAAGRKAGRPAVRARCDCGNVKVAQLDNVLNGRTRSCGCLWNDQMAAQWSDPEYVAEQRERSRQAMTEFWANSPDGYAETVSKRMAETNRKLWTDPEFVARKRAVGRQRFQTHGLSAHPLYRIHDGMMARCYRSTAKGYHNYGGRGIQVFGPWHSVVVALPEMSQILGPRPARATLDRINNNGHYEPGNIQWATPEEQGANHGHGTVLPLVSPECSRGVDCPCQR